MLQRIVRWLLRAHARLFVKPFTGPPFPVGFQRRWSELQATGSRRPRSTTVERLDAGPVPIYRIGPGGGPEDPAERPATVWAHGGGFVLGGLRTHDGLAGQIARASGADVYLPEYRLAPEHPAPAPSDDLFAAYKAVVGRGHDPSRMALGGDSAGGALAITTALALREMDVPSPAAMILISPVTDLGLTGPSVVEKARVEPMLREAWLRQGFAAHAGEMARTDPRVSPLYADLGGLPPILIQVGEDEVLLDDSTRFADRAWAAGVEVELQRFPDLWHDFQLAAPILRAATEAIGDIGAFLARRWQPKEREG